MLISLLQQRLAAPLQVSTITSNPLNGLTLFPLLITLSPALNIGMNFFHKLLEHLTCYNYFFNNRLESLNGRSAILIKKYARDNYVSQSNIGGNDVDIRNWTIKPETNGFHDNSGFHSPDVQ